MTETAFLDGRVVLHAGDCRDVIRALPDASIDSCVTDPPYALVSIGRRFGADNAAPAKVGKSGAYARASAGFMGKKWDTGEVAFDPDFWADVLRVLKPGAHLVAFGGTRSYHRLACAIEDAGFEIRDQLAWAYGAGFPKSHNVSRNLNGDRCACEGQKGAVSDLQCDLRPMRNGDVSPTIYPKNECGEVLLEGVSQHGAPRSVLRPEPCKGGYGTEEQGMEGRCDAPTSQGKLRPSPLYSMPAEPDVDGEAGWVRDGASLGDGEADRTSVAPTGVRSSPRPSAAEQRVNELGALAGQSESQARGAWPYCARCGKPIVPDGLGTALKPAWEPIVLARKPLSGTVAETVLAHGTGAMNIDGCRVAVPDGDQLVSFDRAAGNVSRENWRKGTCVGGGKPVDHGRWPANIVHDGSDEVVAAFPQSNGQQGVVTGNEPSSPFANVYGDMPSRVGRAEPRGDAGSAARFFYSAKADANDRIGSKHPTVKPVDLMQWLCRLVTPPGGTVLDPFAGTGTTGEAAFREGFKAVLIEREEEYRADIARRMELALAGPDERARESLKARGKADYDAGPLFGGGEAAA